MQYEKANEKSPVTPVYESQSTYSQQDYRQNSDIRKARTTVIVLLSIQFFFVVLYFILKCVDLGQYLSLSAAAREGRSVVPYAGSVVAAGISVLYLIIFLIVTAKYKRIGILIFAWLGLLQLILVIIIIILAIVLIVGISVGAKTVGLGIAMSVVVIVIAGIVCLLTILTVVFSFKLAKLLKMHQAYQLV